MRIKAPTSREVVTGNQILQLEEEKWDGYIYDFTSILEANLDPDETFIRDPDFPDLLNSRCRHKKYENMNLEIQDPIKARLHGTI